VFKQSTVSIGAKKCLMIAMVAICAGTGAAHAAAGPAVKSVAGGQTQKKAIWGPAEVNGRSLFPAYRDLGVGIYQSVAFWNQIAVRRPANPTDPSDPAYRWPTDLGPAVDEAAANGMQVSIMIIGTPPWANGGRSARWVPTDPADFADFATAISRRYPTVRLWMIWGEPNRSSNFAPLTPARFTGPLTRAQQVAPHNYAKILDAAYGALKSVNPANLVIGGNTFNSAGPLVIHPYQWIRYLKLPDGSTPRMDMYGHNPFGYRKPDLHDPPSPKGRVDFSDLGRLARALDRRFPGPPLPLYLSEWGVGAGGNPDGPGNQVSFRTQAEWIHAGYRIARNWKRIYTLGWVHALDSAISPQGLFDMDGNPKPGYYAMKAS
jgi:hypothetical protein